MAPPRETVVAAPRCRGTTPLHTPCYRAFVRLFALAAALVAGVALAGCEPGNEPRFDSAPIAIATPGGGIMLAVTTEATDEPIVAVVDTLTPTTVIDELEVPADELTPASQTLTDLRLASACSVEDPTGGCTPINRALFSAARVVDVHPCQDPAVVCEIGAAGSTSEYRGIIGAELLSSLAVRIDTTTATPFIQLFEDQPGSSRRRCAEGESVLSTGLGGGGTLIIQGGEVRFGPTRIAFDTCLGIDPNDLATPSGANALLLLSTGLGPSLLSESAYRRLRSSFAEDDASRPPSLEDLPATSVLLPSGNVSGRAVTLPALALVDQLDTQTSQTRGACLEWNLRANLGDDAVVDRSGTFACTSAAACPCAPSETPDGPSQVIACQAAAAVQVSPAAGLPFVVVGDELPLLQALRVELRPRVPDVDGVLGMSALANLRTDLDYPNGRVIMKCGAEADPAECMSYTAINRRSRPGSTEPAVIAARCNP